MFKLSDFAKKNGYQFEAFESVDSTNIVAKIRFHESVDQQKALGCDKYFIIARAQSKGQGRRGRGWYSPKNNLSLSLILRSNFQVQNVAQLGFVASLSVFETIKDLAIAFGVDKKLLKIKWPNDILLNEGKISGSMIDLLHYKGEMAAILGIGVNILAKYEQATYKTSHLHEYGIMTSIEEFFEKFSYYWAKNFTIWQQKGGSIEIRNLWAQNVVGLGQALIVKLRNEEIEGIFEMIDNEYCLLLRKKNGIIEKISSGDIFFQNAGTSRRED